VVWGPSGQWWVGCEQGEGGFGLGLGVYVSDEVFFEVCCGRFRVGSKGLGEALGVPH
jgi:hypothetical protein